MAREELTPQPIPLTGLEATYAAAAADGNKFVNDGATMVHIKNGTGDCVITIQIAKTVDGQAVTDPTVTCTANEERFLPSLPPSIYNQADGMVYLDYDDESNVTIAVIKTRR